MKNFVKDKNKASHIVQQNKIMLKALQISWERSEAGPGTSNIRFEMRSTQKRGKSLHCFTII